MDMDSSILLEIDRITKHFGGVLALDDVSFRVREGQILALIGPNGAGKTTLLNVIAGQISPTRGQVRFQGKRLAGRPAHERVRLGIARTFQQALIFEDMTVLENVMAGCHLRGRAGVVDAALRLSRSLREEEDIYLDAYHFVNLVGLGTKASQKAGDLPFGQQRLLAIARALASDPTLMLLDEPSAGLNRLEKEYLVGLIERIRRMGLTIILVEHDMQLVMRLADWIVVLDHGQRLAQGETEEIRRDRAVIMAYLGTKEGAC